MPSVDAAPIEPQLTAGAEPVGLAAPSFADRVLTEAIAAYEKQSSAIIDDARANEAARRADGDLETRVIARARAHPTADALRAAIHHVRFAIGWILAAAIVLVIVAGAATARTMLGSPVSAA